MSVAGFEIATDRVAKATKTAFVNENSCSVATIFLCFSEKQETHIQDKRQDILGFIPTKKVKSGK